MTMRILGSLLIAGCVLSMVWTAPWKHATAQSQTDRLELLVPAYFYPLPNDPNWLALADAATRVPLTAIVNPGSGPGTVRDRNYTIAINRLRIAGGRAVGYVHTSYARRALIDVVADINRYRQLYSVDGFFIDEMARRGDSQTLLYYRSIYDYIKALDPNYRVIGNPGTNSDWAFLTLPAADAVVNFESAKRVYNNYQVSSWAYTAQPQQLGHLIYRTRTVGAMRRVLLTAVQRNAGLVYVTDDKLSNPWDTLPAYWPEQVRCIEQINAGVNC